MAAGIPTRLTRTLGAPLAVALALRLLFSLVYWVGQPLTHDEQEYLGLGQSLAAGRGFVYDEPAGSSEAPERFGRAPLYPLFVSVFAHRADDAGVLTTVKVAQAVLGTLAVLLVAMLARRVAGSAATAPAAWIAAMYPPLIWTTGFIWSETLYSVLALGNVLLLGTLIDGPSATPSPTAARSVRRLLVAGIVGGLAALTRPAHVFFLLLVGLWLLFTRRPVWAAVVAVGAFLVIAPWTARNYAVYGRPVLIASEGGVTFWTGNHALAIGEGDMAANPAIKLDNRRVRATHPGLSPEALEQVYYREAFATIAAQPGWWLGLEARKLFYLAVPIGPSYMLHSRLYRVATWASYGLIVLPGLVGLTWAGSRGATPRTIWLLMASVVVACLIFLPQERFRIPALDPGLIVGTAACVAFWFRRYPAVAAGHWPHDPTP